MKQVFVFFVLVIFFAFSCQRAKVSKNLSEIDSLIVGELYDSAYHLVEAMDESDFHTPEDLAHFNLLRVQTAYLVNKPLASSDSILDVVISYYDQHVNYEKLVDAYYYKAIGANARGDYQQSIINYKEAEHLALQSGNIRQQYKIAEGITYVNGVCANVDLQLSYAKKTLGLSQKIGNRRWIAYSYYWLSYAYSKKGIEDSVLYYTQQIIPFIKDVNETELPYFLCGGAYLLRSSNPVEAKKYLLRSLSYNEQTVTYEYLAEIAYDEGKPDEAYHYWKRVLTIQDATPKDNVIHNLIEYDMERGKTDSICERINEIIAIRDSIDAKLKNDTIKDLQTRFDHEVAMREKDQIVIRWQWVAIILVVLLLIGTVYYLVRKYQVRIKLQRSQMQINDYMEQIRALQSDKSDRTAEIERLNKQIERIMEEKSPRLAQGRMLYDMVVANKKMDRWKKEDVKKFIEYYTATNYRVVNRLRSIPRKEELTPHHLLYLILQEMGKTDQEIRLILSISKETLRTLRFRTKPLDEIESEKSDQTL